MKASRILIAAAYILGLAAGAGAADVRGIPVDGFAASVNKQIITIGDVLQLIQPVRIQIQSSYEGEELDAKLKEAFNTGLRSLIERELILAEFADSGGQLPDRLIDDQISSIVNDRFRNDRAAFLEELSAQRMTLADLRDDVRKRLVVSIMRRKEVTDRVAISPLRIRQLYEERIETYRLPAQAKLSMIVLHRGTSQEDRAVKREEADKTRMRLLEGADFAEVAKAVSEGPKAAQGGDFGWLGTGELRPELSGIAASLEPGRVSEVIETDDELYILKVEARKSASVVPFDDVRNDIREGLRKQEEERLYRDWINRLEKKYYVKIYSEA